jgi:hypothetical protein
VQAINMQFFQNGQMDEKETGEIHSPVSFLWEERGLYLFI